jgi:hypothetical protein
MLQLLSAINELFSKERLAGPLPTQDANVTTEFSQ